jgi:6-phosphogluconolactonase/glucosamine-6-phosphate isomerase/deaminase
MIRETLLTRAGGEATLLAPETSLPLDACVGAYEKQLQGIKPDLVIIGMGDDGHIASLFPPLPPEVFGPTNVIHTTTDTFAVRDRISVTLPLLVSSKRRLFLITGPKKAALLQTMQQASEDVSLYPAQYFFDERSTWFVGP